jgi:heme oxygenase (mycobilin-producing)
MAVRVLIERQIVPAEKQTVFQLLRKLRSRCLEEPGYISGETLRDNADENTIVVISTWFGLMDWKSWYASEDRRAFEQEIRQHLRGPERVQVLLEGISDRLSGA